MQGSLDQVGAVQCNPLYFNDGWREVVLGTMVWWNVTRYSAVSRDMKWASVPLYGVVVGCGEWFDDIIASCSAERCCVPQPCVGWVCCAA